MCVCVCVCVLGGGGDRHAFSRRKVVHGIEHMEHDFFACSRVPAAPSQKNAKRPAPYYLFWPPSERVLTGMPALV